MITYQCLGPRIGGEQQNGRMPCGADMTPLIAAVPADDEVHEAVCPQCGTTTTVRRTPAEK